MEKYLIVSIYRKNHQYKKLSKALYSALFTNSSYKLKLIIDLHRDMGWLFILIHKRPETIDVQQLRASYEK